MLEFLDCALESLQIAYLCGNPTDRDRWLERARKWTQLAEAEAGEEAVPPELGELLRELDGDWTRAARELRKLAEVLRTAGEDRIVIELDAD